MAAFVSGDDQAPAMMSIVTEPVVHEGATQGVSVVDVGASVPAEVVGTVHSIDGGKPATRRTKTVAKAGRRLETRSDGSVSRKVTVYLSPELDKQLSLHAVSNEIDRSDIVSEALARYLRKA